MTVACQDPPVRTSSTAVPDLAGSQPSKWLGCVRTCQALSRGAFRVRVTVNSLIRILPYVGFAEQRPRSGRMRDTTRAGGELAYRRSAAAQRCRARRLLPVVLEPSIGGHGSVVGGFGGTDPGVDGEQRDEGTGREDDRAGEEAGNVAVRQRHRRGVAWQVASGHGRGDGGQRG